MSDASLQTNLHKPATGLPPPVTSDTSTGQKKESTHEKIDLVSLTADDFAKVDKGDGAAQNKAKALAAATQVSNPQSQSTSSSGSSEPVKPGGNTVLLTQPQPKSKPDTITVSRESKSLKGLPPLESIKPSVKPTGVNALAPSRESAGSGHSVPDAATLPPSKSSTFKLHFPPASSAGKEPANLTSQSGPSIAPPDSSRGRSDTENFQAPAQTHATGGTDPDAEAHFNSLYDINPAGGNARPKDTTLDLGIRLESTSDRKGEPSDDHRVKTHPVRHARSNDLCKWGTGMAASLATGVVSVLFIEGPYAAARQDASFSNLLPGIGLGLSALLLIGTSLKLATSQMN